MNSVLRIAIVDPCATDREQLKRLLTDMEPIWVEAECSHYEEFPELLQQANPDVAVIGLDSHPQEALRLVSHIAQNSPHTRVFVTSADSNSQRILQAMRAGANEYLTTPVRMEDLLPALDRCRQSCSRDDNPTQGSVVTAVTGAIGGVGATCLAVNLACCLAADKNNRVVLADLDMVLGDADVCLDLVHNYTLLDLVENIDRLDFTLLKRSMIRHSSGLLFLPHPLNLADTARVRPESLARLIGLMKATFTHLVLDLSNGFRETDIAAMQAADIILLVAQLNVSCLRNIARIFKALECVEGMLDRIKVVLNRVGGRDQTIPVEKAEETIGRKVFWQIPNDWQRVNESRNNGVPLVLHSPRSKAAIAIKELARALYCPEESQVNGRPKARKRRFFSLIP